MKVKTGDMFRSYSGKEGYFIYMCSEQNEMMFLQYNYSMVRLAPVTPAACLRFQKIENKREIEIVYSEVRNALVYFNILHDVLNDKRWPEGHIIKPRGNPRMEELNGSKHVC